MLARVTNSLIPQRSRSLFNDPIDRLFDDVLTDWRYLDRIPARSVPNYSMKVTDDGVLSCEVELPGVSAKDLDLTIDAAEVVIKGKRNEAEFSYVFKPSSEFDLATAAAQIKDGVLTIKINPYARSEPKKIPLNVG